jgi:signal transduction histidine kinase
MELDQSTMAAVLGMKSVLAGLVFYLLHVSARRIPGLYLWALASFAVGLAVLLDLSGLIANPPLASLLFNIPLVGGQVLFLFGAAQFVGRPFRRTALPLLLATVTLLALTWTLVFPDSVLRVLSLTPLYAGANAWMAWLLWQHRAANAQAAYGIAAATMLVQAGAALAQAAFALVAAEIVFQTAPWATPANVLIWINAVLTIVLGSWVLFLLIMLRLVDELKAAAEREERERIARDLHDTVLQTFQGFVMKASAMLPDAESALGDTLSHCLRDATLAIKEGREKVASLRGVSSQSLHDVLRCAAVQAAGPGQEFSLRYAGKPRALDPIVQQELCAIGQEAICNAYRHAQARHHELIVDYGADTLVLTVRDDGQGIAPSEREKCGHWGLRGIEERARLIHADATLRSAPGAGTTWRVELKAALAYADVRPLPRPRIYSVSTEK